MKNALKAMFLVAAIAVVSTAPAQAWDTPLCLEGGKIVTTEELNALIASGGVAVFDARKKISYVESHLPTAKGIAAAYDSETKRLDTSVLGQDKSALIVIYSHGTDGWKSYYSARSAIEDGFTNIMWYRGGYATWLENNLPLEN